MERRKRSKDAPTTNPMAEMCRQYDLCVEADRTQRDLAIEDWEFITIPGEQWDANMRKLRKGRPCYEFSILRAHWRQVNNDQKKARPSIKVRPVENGDVKDAELRQGLIRNIEKTSNASDAYDSAMEYVTASGFGAWLLTTDYADDEAFEQDIRIRPIDDPLNSVWLDPNDPDDPAYGFIEKTYTRDAFRAEFPKAEAVSFESSAQSGITGWFGEDTIRVVAWYRTKPVEFELLQLSDGRTIKRDADTDSVLDELAQQGINLVNTRKVRGKQVVMSICSGTEEIDGPYELPFHKIPIIGVWANRFKHEGKWHYCGMVRFSRDPQKLVNYNLTSGMEAVGKTPKSPYLVTPTMLGGDGVKEKWANAAASDPFFLPYTPDPNAPGGRPMREAPPDVPAALLQLASTSVDMLKATDGIYDASVGARSNETSGRAILARQQEGDTATFDYQDAIAKGIRKCGELILKALPKVYDTPRAMRVIGNDGSEQMVTLYEEVQDQQTGRPVKLNDLGKGRFDLSVSSGPSYDTMRMEFQDVMTNLSQSNPMVAQAAPDLIVKALDFPGAEEVAERLKMLLPPPIQQKMAEGKDLPPEAMAAMQQAQEMMAQAQQQQMMLQQAMAQLEQEKAATDAEKQQLASDKALLDANFKRMQAELRAAEVSAKADHVTRQNELSQRSSEVDQMGQEVDDAKQEVEAESAVLEAAKSVVEQASALMERQAEMIAQVAQVAATISQPKQAMQVVRDEAGRVAGIVPVAA